MTTTSTDSTKTDDGVRVVGAPAKDKNAEPLTDPKAGHDGASVDDSADAPPPRTASGRPGGDPSGPSPRTYRLVRLIAVIGIVGTLLFGVLYATEGSGSSGQNPAVTTAAQTFLTDFFNFNAKTVDGDFTAVTNMATGSFAGQAKQFFNSSIRLALEKALAESRGQTRALYVQSENANSAVVYAVVDQTYVNNKISSPQADVVRMVINLQNVNGNWMISDVTVLEGATPTSAGTASGSAGSNVPGQ
jgi:Mce-associated membrane protein